MLAPITSSALAGIRHGFFGRAGGMSQGIYSSLNAGLGSDDDPAAVAENRRRVAEAIGLAPTHLQGVYQIHSADAVRVDEPRPLRRADAMVTRTQGIGLCILAADCAPVLFADVEAGVIGAAHAGWKGALGGVLEAAIAEMEAICAQRARIAAVIGPCIASPPWYARNGKPPHVTKFVPDEDVVMPSGRKSTARKNS